MPNWCANRLTFSGIQQHADELKSWVRGEQSSLPGRAKREGIQLFWPVAPVSCDRIRSRRICPVRR
jgi:hypothetical protein